jgi:diguanylate cyclase (GGDEF)-like protein
MKADSHLLVLRSALDTEELAGLRLFADADLEAVAEILANCPMHVLRKDETLLVPGATNSHLYLVLHGRLRVQLGSVDAAPVRLVEAGEAVGEISLIDEKPTSAYVVADTAATVLALDQATFWSLVNASHAVARNMLLMVVERMRANNTRAAAGLRARDGYRHCANVDDLTGLRNLRALTDLLRRQMLRSSMNDQALALLTVDIDNFKGFNAEFGFAAGDQALQAVGQSLQDSLRPTDIVARIDGEKFAIVLPECDVNGAELVAARLREAVAETLIVMSDESILPPVTISIGIAEMGGCATAEEMLHASKQALARAKRGRNSDAA